LQLPAAAYQQDQYYHKEDTATQQETYKKRKGVPFSQNKPIEVKELLSHLRKIQVTKNAAQVQDTQLPKPGKGRSRGKKLEINPPVIYAPIKASQYKTRSITSKGILLRYQQASPLFYRSNDTIKRTNKLSPTVLIIITPILK
jgi:hypothetical protein